MHESYTPFLLTRLAVAQNPSLRRNETPLTREFYTNLFGKLREILFRPIEILLHCLVVQLIAFVIAVKFRVYALQLSTYASVLAYIISLN